MSPFSPDVGFHIAGVPVAYFVVTTWAIVALLATAAWLVTRHLRVEQPGRVQSGVEIAVEAIASQLRDAMQIDPAPYLPLLGTLFVFVVVSNLAAVVPRVSPPTAHVETPAALALVVLFATHYYGIRARGLRGHLAAYAKPSPLLLPLNVLAELTRTFSLTVRLFGNIMSHELVLGIVVALAGLLVPVPLMLLGVLIGVVQAYIFTMLAAVFLGAAISARDA